MSAISNALQFVRRFVADPRSVGAVAPSSRWLADALIEPAIACVRPMRVLEVGAGTGVITGRLAERIKPTDRLDINEMDNTFVDILRLQMETTPAMWSAHEQGRLRILHSPVQAIDGEDVYDFIVCGLPFTSFDAALVEDVLATIGRLLKPGGVFSYFEYIGLRRLTRRFSLSMQTRQRVGEVSDVMDAHIGDKEFARRTVLLNVLPAYARFWRFDNHTPTPTAD